MVWAGFSCLGKTKLVFCDGKQKSMNYIDTLKEGLLPFIQVHKKKKLKLQQDNAPIHTSTETTNFIKAKKIPVLPWPSKSPDLNPMENMWAILVEKIYKNGRQFQTKEQLKKAIQKYWKEIGQDTIDTLVDSMKMHCCLVMTAGGNKIKY